MSLCRKRHSVGRPSVPARSAPLAQSDQDSDVDLTPSRSLRQNQQGQKILGNGIVSLRNLDLNLKIPSRTSDPDAKSFFGSKMSWSQSYTCFCLIFGQIPVERHRDLSIRKNICRSAAAYALSYAQIEILEAEEDHNMNAYLLGMGRNTMQKLKYYFYCLLLFLFFTIISIVYNYFDYFNRYNLWGVIHAFLNNSVFLKTGLRGFPQVQTHLGLTGANEHRSIMNMYVLTIFCFQAFPSISNIVHPCFHCSWDGVYDTICPNYIPNFVKTKRKKSEDGALSRDWEDDSKSGPLMRHYDADVHEALAWLRMLDGSSFSDKAGQSVNFFTAKGKPKCWFKKSDAKQPFR